MACFADPARDREGDLRRLAGQSRTLTFWILVSRATGFGRVAVVAAVLGPTWFGNIFQIVAVLPAAVYSLLGGSLTSALLVPLLVKHMDHEGAGRMAQLANGALGLVGALLLCMCALGAASAPGLLHGLTFSVADEAARAYQVQIGIPLFVLVLPQLALYGIVGVGISVQQAHGAFALAAAGSALENLGIIVVFLGSAAAFGTGAAGDAISPAHVLALGGGCTAAVALHAGLQWLGARRVGVTLLPRAGWRDPELRGVVWNGVASIGCSAFYSAAFLAVITTVARVPGGSVAFQIAHSCCQFPIALTATPLATAQLPFLSRLHNERRFAEFTAAYRDGIRLVLFAALPAGLLLCTIPRTFASAVAFGEMATPAGVTLIAACLATSGVGIIGEAVVVLSTTAAYAKCDVTVPLRAMTARLAVVVAGVASCSSLDGVSLLWGVGASLGLGNIAAALWLHVQQARALPAMGRHPGTGRLGSILIQAVSLLPALAVAGWTGDDGGALHHAAVATAAAGASLALYVGLHKLRGTCELSLFLPILARGDAQFRVR